MNGGRPTMPIVAEELLCRHRAAWRHRDRVGAIVPFSEQPDPWTAFRTYRAVSWLRLAEQHAGGDVDAAFIFLWIAFDCAYGTKERGVPEPAMMSRFFDQLVRHDGGAVYDAVWRRFSGPVKAVLQDEFLFEPRLYELAGTPSVVDWRETLARKNREVLHALRDRTRTLTTLNEVFARLYCLRNQLFHGGAKWGSTRNRESLRSAHAIMAFLVPTFVAVMIDARGGIRLGEPRYYLQGDGA